MKYAQGFVSGSGCVPAPSPFLLIVDYVNYCSCYFHIVLIFTVLVLLLKHKQYSHTAQHNTTHSHVQSRIHSSLTMSIHVDTPHTHTHRHTGIFIFCG